LVSLDGVEVDPPDESDDDFVSFDDVSLEPESVDLAGLVSLAVLESPDDLPSLPADADDPEPLLSVL
jgi:hypothetical protein